MKAGLVSRGWVRTSRSKKRETNLAPFDLGSIQCKYELLQLYRYSTGSTLKPCTVSNTNPLSQPEERMGRPHNNWGGI